ncbi:hypothetical protein C2845_PM02G35920 [Panicum miliaceum]|uniref:Uncharacterized protein n=1 Tax=Panicum miliaceum TaxID=4540 RepID=A0A3L6S492_PANMI|nr:hypothetical protein C2845_PM02G35920 [Panicum miliaceum]
MQDEGEGGESGRQQGVRGRLRPRGQRGDGRRGIWVSLQGKDRGAVVEEGVHFVQDSEVGGGDEYLFVSDSEDETSDDFNEGYIIANIEEQQVHGVEEQPGEEVEAIEGLEDVAQRDIAGHAQPLEEEVKADHPEPQEKDAGDSNKFKENGGNK